MIVTLHSERFYTINSNNKLFIEDNKQQPQINYLNKFITIYMCRSFYFDQFCGRCVHTYEADFVAKWTDKENNETKKIDVSNFTVKLISFFY